MDHFTTGFISVLTIHFIGFAELEILIKIALECTVAAATVYKLLKTQDKENQQEEQEE